MQKNLAKNRGMTPVRPAKLLGLLVPLVLLAGCGIFEEKEALLPGKRIAVILDENDATPDARLVDLTVTLPKPYRNDSWMQAGGFADHTLYHLALADQVEKAWSRSIGSGSSSSRLVLAQPVVADGIIYTMDRDYEIQAQRLDDGAVIWSTELEIPDEDEDAFGGGIAFANGNLYVTTGFAQIVALKAQDGSEIWHRALSAPVRSAPTVVDDRLVVITIDNRTYALDAQNGNELWTHAGFAESAGLVGGASPAISEGIVVVPYTSGEIFGLRLSNGRPVWGDNLASVRRVDALASLADIRGAPVVDRGVVYAISHAGTMVAIDIRSGVRLWDKRLGGAQTPWMAGDYLYLITNDSLVLAVTRQGGRVRWATGLPNFNDPDVKEEPITWAGPVLAGDRLIVASSEGEVWSLSPYDGTPLGREDLGDRVRVSPLVVDQTLLILDDDGDLHAYR